VKNKTKTAQIKSRAARVNICVNKMKKPIWRA